MLTEASRRLRAVLVRAFVAVAVALGGIYLIVTGEYFLTSILIPFVIMSLAALGVNVLVGYCGQISLGSAA